MIKEIIKQWDKNKGKLEEWFKTNDLVTLDYRTIVEAIFTYVISGYNVSRIHEIDDGDYQGTQLFIIPKDTYQPSREDYLVTDTYYGSCSGCDTLLAITDYRDKKLSEEDVKNLMTIALHLVQKLNKL